VGNETQSVKCIRDIRDIQPAAYRLKSDGRKWMHECKLRCDLAQWLATFANPDGSSITVGVDRMMKRLSVSRRTVQRLLDDLAALGFLTNGKLTKFKGTRRRVLNVAAIVATSVPDTGARLCQIENASVPDKGARLCQIENASVPDTQFESATTGESGTQPSLADRQIRPPDPNRPALDNPWGWPDEYFV
jgi:hypothetical protein